MDMVFPNIAKDHEANSLRAVVVYADDNNCLCYDEEHTKFVPGAELKKLFLLGQLVIFDTEGGNFVKPVMCGDEDDYVRVNDADGHLYTSDGCVAVAPN